MVWFLPHWNAETEVKIHIKEHLLCEPNCKKLFSMECIKTEIHWHSDEHLSEAGKIQDFTSTPTVKQELDGAPSTSMENRPHPSTEAQEETEFKIDIEEHPLYKDELEIDGNETVESVTDVSGREVNEPAFVPALDIQGNRDVVGQFYPLAECGSTTSSLLQRAKKQQELTTRTYRCTKCKYVTNRKDNLTCHVKTHDSHATSQCDPTTESKIAVGKHAERQHASGFKLRNDTKHKHASKSKKNFSKRDPEPTQVYKCAECNHTTKIKKYLWLHRRTHHDANAPTYACAQCDYTTKFKCSLVRHGEIHHSGSQAYTCAECNYKTKTGQGLRLHTRMHHDPDAPTYSCTKCEYVTKLKRYLASHIKIHDDHSAQGYTCTQCSHKAKTRSGLLFHTRMKHDPRAQTYTCTKCEYVTKQKHNLARHTDNHHSEVYTCTECNHKTKTKNGLRLHARMKHDPSAPTYSCAKCKYVTKRKRDLIGHMNVHNDGAKDPKFTVDTADPSLCDKQLELCGKETAKLVTKDVLYKSTGKKLESDRQPEVAEIRALTSTLATDGEPSTPTYDCTKRKYVTKWKNNLVHHVKIHDLHAADTTTESELVLGQRTKQGLASGCKPCDNTEGNNTSKWENHFLEYVRSKYNATGYECAECNRRIKTKDGLLLHQRRCHNPNSQAYRCAKCPYATKVKCNFLRHVNTHHDGKVVYACTECDHTTTNRKGLRLHMRMHSAPNAPKYACAKCEYVTMLKRNFVRHSKTHRDSPEEGYTCAECNHTTKTERGLRSHKMKHHDPSAPTYTCAKCEYVTKVKYQLVYHIKTHHPDSKVYTCTECNHKTKTRHGLWLHRRVHHNPSAPTYTCAKCEYVTKLKDNFVRHMQIHNSDAQVYKCEQCGDTAKTKDSFVQHMRTHQDPGATTHIKLPNHDAEDTDFKVSIEDHPLCKEELEPDKNKTEESVTDVMVATQPKPKIASCSI